MLPKILIGLVGSVLLFISSLAIGYSILSTPTSGEAIPTGDECTINERTLLAKDLTDFCSVEKNTCDFTVTIGDSDARTIIFSSSYITAKFAKDIVGVAKPNKWYRCGFRTMYFSNPKDRLFIKVILNEEGENL